MNTNIEIKRTDSGSEDFRSLIVLLDAVLAENNGNEHAFFSQFNGVNMIKHVIVAYCDNKPVGCGAFKEYDDKTVEIKRMFVLQEYRGKGVAKKILAELEKWAAESGYSSSILETAKKLTSAMALYHKAGYDIIENYAPYIGVETSACFSKSLSND